MKRAVKSDKAQPERRPAAIAAGTTSAVDFRDVKFSWDLAKKDPAQNFQLTIPRLEIKRGEKLLLIGPSGSGKSTLLSLLCGIAAAQSGQVKILDHDLGDFSAQGRDLFRAEHFGIIFQMFNLLPYGSVIDNVILPLHFAKGRRQRVGLNEAHDAEARRLLGRLGLDGDIQSRTTTHALSVGQQQRVAAARALIGSPEIIVADEPTSALDRNRQNAFLDLLMEEVGAAASTLVMVSHDESLGGVFDRVVHLNDIITTDMAEAIR